eukprot:2352309-Pleurochrysis_carterae.AAC.4
MLAATRVAKLLNLHNGYRLVMCAEVASRLCRLKSTNDKVQDKDYRTEGLGMVDMANGSSRIRSSAAA